LIVSNPTSLSDGAEHGAILLMLIFVFQDTYVNNSYRDQVIRKDGAICRPRIFPALLQSWIRRKI